jgi:PAS domain S-box-containing protein
MDIFNKEDRKFSIKEGIEIPQSLRGNSNFLNLILTTTPNSIYVYNLEQKNFMYANSYSETVFGYTSQQIIDYGNDFFLKLVHPEDLPQLHEHYIMMMDLGNGESRYIELRFRHAKGSWIWLLLNESVLERGEDGKVQKVIGNAADVTKKKVKKNRPEENPDFIKSVMNTTPGNIFLVDTKVNRILFDSLNALRTLGYTPKDMIEFGDQVLPKLLHPDDLASVAAATKKLDESPTDENITYIVRFRHADGSWHWFNITIRAFKRDANGALSQVVGVAIDITPQKEAEIQLKESKEFIEKLLVTTPGNIFLLDTIEFKVLFDSLNALKMLGYSSDETKEFGNEFFPKMLHPDDAEIPRNNIEKLKELKTDENLSYVARFRHANGSWRWFNVTLRPFKRNEKGMITEAVGVAIDMTPQKEAEIQLKENKEFMEKLLETTPGNIFLFDTKEFKVLFDSMNALRSLGYAPEDMVKFGNDFFPRLLHPDDTEIPKTTIEELNKSNTDQNLSYVARFRHANGSWRWMSVTLRPFKRDEDGNLAEAVGVALDITPQKEAEIRLKESKEFVEKVIDTSPNDIFIFDLIENRNVFASKNLLPVLGYAPDQIAELNDQFLFQLLHPEDLPIVRNNFQKLKELKTDQTFSIEIRLENALESYHWVSVNSRPFKRDPKGEVVQIIISAIDITARKKAEEELRANKLFIEKITETAPDIIYVFDLVEMKYIFINKTAIKRLGYSQEQIYQMGDTLIPELMHKEDFPKISVHFNELRTSVQDIVKPIEYRIRDSKGEWHWFIGNDAVFQRDDEGKVSHIAGVATDITYIKKIENELKDLNINLEEKVRERTQELQESEKNLRQSENQLKLITNSIPALISYIDNKETYRFANPFYQNLLNVPGEITGKQIKNVVGTEAYAIAKENFQKALKGEAVSFENNKVAMKDGSVKTLNINFIPDKDEENKTRGIVVMGVDITDRIEYEKILENKNTDLKRINADLDNFIYTASHDLRTPIANLEGLLNGIKQDIHEHRGDISVMFDMMNLSIQRLKTTILELTEISKIQRNHSTDKEFLSISQIIEEFKTEFSVQIKNSKAVIIPQLEIHTIWFSRKNFRSIIYNLLDNAIKYRSPERPPEIIIKTAMIKEDCMLMTVKDNGLGFDIRHKDKVFGMFQRMHTHTEGTGLGLYIVKKIAENAGGGIDVESEVDKGSVFKLYFKVPK